MHVRKFIFSLVLLGVGFSAQASLIYDAVDSEKNGAAIFLSIDGMSLTGAGQMVFNEIDNSEDFTVDFTAQVSSNTNESWLLDFSLITSTDFGTYNERCPNRTDCDTDGWLFLGLDASQQSTITGDSGLQYVIDDAWGQFGFNAGGIAVTPVDGFASGFWLKQWTASDGRTGTGGDANVYVTQVPEPGVLALLGIGFISLRRAIRRESK